jgi:glutaredoxin
MNAPIAVLLAILGIVAGATLHAAEAPPQPRIDIYTSASCGYCRTLKRYLAARDLAYVEHNINATLETREAFYAMGGRGTPLVVIGEHRIHGFNPLRIEAALDAARESAAAGAPATD